MYLREFITVKYCFPQKYLDSVLMFLQRRMQRLALIRMHQINTNHVTSQNNSHVFIMLVSHTKRRTYTIINHSLYKVSN